VKPIEMDARSFRSSMASSSTVQQEQRFARSNKIADLWDKFDHAFRFFGLDEKRLYVDRDHNR
jgi:hypothetical protein